MKREPIPPQAQPSTARYIAANLTILAGISLVAALWFQPLTDQSVIACILGGAYLIVGIGLYGQSRFALIMGILLPSLLISLVLNTRAPDEIANFQAIRMVVEAVIIIACIYELWRVRHNPSV